MVQLLVLSTVTASSGDLGITQGQIRITNELSQQATILPVNIPARGVVKRTYGAGTARVTTYTLVSGTIVANTTYSITINGKAYSYVVGSVVPTSTVLCANIALQINNNSNAPCTATSGATTVVLTGKASTENWLFTSVADTTLWINSVGTVGTAGINTPAQVLDRYGYTTTGTFTSYEILIERKNSDTNGQTLANSIDQFNVLINVANANAAALITSLDNTFNGLDIAGTVAESKLIEVSQ